MAGPAVLALRRMRNRMSSLAEREALGAASGGVVKMRAANDQVVGFLNCLVIYLTRHFCFYYNFLKVCLFNKKWFTNCLLIVY